MELIVGKRINNVKVTKVVNDTVYYTKTWYFLGFKHWTKSNADFDTFKFMYPENCK